MNIRLFGLELKEGLHMAVEAIRDNKLRSALTLLGIVIGVFSVIGVMTALRTLESSINEGLNIFGTNTFAIQKNPAIQMGHHTRVRFRNRREITLDQFKKLKKRTSLPRTISVGDARGGIMAQHKDRMTKKNVILRGGDEWTLRNFNTYVGEGRNITDQDIQFSRKVCVLGTDVMDILFPFESPLGKEVIIEGVKYRVVGIAEPQGQMFGQSRDNFITVPISTYLNKYGHRRTSLLISVEAESAERYDDTVDEIVGIFRTIRQLPPAADNDFEIISNNTLIEAFGKFTSGVKLFAFIISIIALVVAGIGIMNIMLVSVTERIKEIGIRKAVGATRRNVLTQFLMEAVFLSEFGGLVGVIIGILGGNVVAAIFNISAVIPMDWAFFGLFVCSLIGIGFGSYPAYKAAKLDPIESLRHE